MDGFPCQMVWEYSDGEHLTGASNALREYEKIAILDRFISETIQDRAIVTVKYQ